MSSFDAIPTRANGQKILHSWFETLKTAGKATGGWVRFSVTYSDLSAAALLNDVLLMTLPIKGVPERIIVKHSASFTGGSLSAYSVSIGLTGELARFVDPFDVFQAPSDDTYADVEIIDGAPSFGGTTGIRIAATSVGANLSAATAGALDVWIKYSTLP